MEPRSLEVQEIYSVLTVVFFGLSGLSEALVLPSCFPVHSFNTHSLGIPRTVGKPRPSGEQKQTWLLAPGARQPHYPVSYEARA